MEGFQNQSKNYLNSKTTLAKRKNINEGPIFQFVRSFVNRSDSCCFVAWFTWLLFCFVAVSWSCTFAFILSACICTRRMSIWYATMEHHVAILLSHLMVLMLGLLLRVIQMKIIEIPKKIRFVVAHGYVKHKLTTSWSTTTFYCFLVSGKGNLMLANQTFHILIGIRSAYCLSSSSRFTDLFQQSEAQPPRSSSHLKSQKIQCQRQSSCVHRFKPSSPTDSPHIYFEPTIFASLTQCG